MGGAVWFYSGVKHKKDVHADGMASSADPDQTALKVCSDLYVQIFRMSTKVVLLFYVHGKHLRSCREGQLT